MKRSGPLKRTPMRRGKGKGKYARRPRDMGYMWKVKQLRCYVAGWPAFTACGGVVEADHAGKRALGQKANDDTCIPLCSHHHRARHNRTDGFKGTGVTQMRAFLDGAIAHTRARLGYVVESDTPSDEASRT